MKSEARTSEKRRTTGETDVRVSICLDGSGEAVVETGVGFFDHMLVSFARHSGIDLKLNCQGDLQVDDHHTLEDCGLTLGSALDEALGERRGIVRFGWACVPMDEALARAAVDLSCRPFAEIDLALRGEQIGNCGCANLVHALESLVITARATVHVDVLRGRNDHHRAEAAFKALALALRGAIRPCGGDKVASTKGVL